MGPADPAVRLSVLHKHLGSSHVKGSLLAIHKTVAECADGIVMSPEVRAAIDQGHAVVALESTIITHGMPFPQNLKTAREVEAIVRAHGAVPATIAVLKGVPHVGLTETQLEQIARAGTAVHKASRRDLPRLAALGLDGATTVSATMLLAHLAGISIFVTGGEGISCFCMFPFRLKGLNRTAPPTHRGKKKTPDTKRKHPLDFFLNV